MAERVSMLFIIARSVLVACPLFLLQFFPLQGYADDEEIVTAVSGTDGNDVITSSDPLAPVAGINTDSAGKITVRATGIDSKSGNDTISSTSVMGILSSAGMSILQAPGKAVVSSESVGIYTGAGADFVNNMASLDAFADALGIYASALVAGFSAADLPGEKKIDFSIGTAAKSSGVVTDDGDDTVVNSELLSATAVSASGGTADQLDTEVADSVTVKAASSSTSTTSGIVTGAGDDQVVNNGTVASTATATSGALALGLVAADDTSPDKKIQINLEADAGAEASATGIETEDDKEENSSDETSPLGLDGLRVTFEKTVSTVSGDDSLTNTDAVAATATSISGSGSAAISSEVSGTVKTSASSSATSLSKALSTGGGSDTITNLGALTSTALATAGAVSLGVEISNPAPAGDPMAEKKKDKKDKSDSTTNVTSSAMAYGIDAEGTGHSVTTSGFAEIADGSLVTGWQKSGNSLAGDDVVDNRGAIVTTAAAISGTESASVVIGSAGSANAESNSTSKSVSSGIYTGGGDDHITSSGVIVSDASAIASAISAGISAGQSTDPETDHKLATRSSTKAEAEASAFGIDSEGKESLSTRSGNVSIGAGGLSTVFEWGAESVAGNDTVLSSNAITVISHAVADSTDASVTINASGSVDSDSGARAGADGVAIGTGGGDDDVDNVGTLTVLSIADADAVAVAMTVSEAEEDAGNDPPVTPKDKSNVKSESGATAEAGAIGIDAEGEDHSNSMTVTVDITGSGLDAGYQSERTSLAGSDTVDNQGNVDVVATATTGAIAAGISIEAEGSVASNAESRATAGSGGIHTGGGDDAIDNSGNLIASSLATATALSVGVSVSQPKTDDTDTSTGILDKLKGRFASTNSVANAVSEANSFGIDADGSGQNEATSFMASISGDGLFIDYINDKSSNSGSNTVSNTGIISAASVATSGAAATEIRVETGGTASSEANATASTKSAGIKTGGGGDFITNQGVVTANSISTAGALAVSFSQNGPGAEAKTEARATSIADAAGISADGSDTDTLTTVSLAINENGIEFLFNRTELSQIGVDQVTNSGPVFASATSTSVAAGAAVTIDGSASADVTSTAKSSATAIDTGGGGDSIDSAGGLSAVATSTAGALSVGFGQKTDEKTKPKVEVKAAATAEATATGILGDSGKDVTTDIGLSITADGLAASYTKQVDAASGDDLIDSKGPVTAVATSNSGAAGATLAIDGAATADIKATAKGTAIAIESGGGNDDVTSDGELTAVATSTAVAVAAGVGQKSSDGSKAKSKVEAETTAVATATGISTDGGDASALTDFSLVIDDSGLVAGFEKSSTSASGNDTVTNTDSVTSTATATSGGAAVAVTIKGGAQSSVDTTATADALGLNTGGGEDVIDNSGTLIAVATATAASANVSVSTEGSAIANAGLLGAGTTASSHAVGITSAGSDYSKSTTADTLIDFDNIGVAAGYESINDSITGDGADNITNTGNVTAVSTATAPQVTVAVTSKGIAASIGRAKSTASAGAIEAGNLGDIIENLGDLSSTATASAFMANVAVTGKGLAVAGNSAWDGGTEAEATATGINADNGKISTNRITAEASLDRAQIVYESETLSASGDDQITNSGAIDTLAIAIAPGVSVAVTPKGVSAAVSTSKARADSTAIIGGDGDDGIDNAGALTSFADAAAVAANVAVTNAGVAAAADAVWDGGTTAEATATGIAGDGGDRSKTTRLAIGTDEMGFDSTTVIASGTDTITNTGAIETEANAGAASASVAVAVKGVGIATSTATAEAKATAIDAGAGEEVDDVYNAGYLSSIARAGAAAASVSVTNQGAAISADSVWDGGTGADARARGIDLGGGGETVTNDGAIDTMAEAGTLSAAVAVAITGVAGATATSTGTADAIAIDASGGDDVDTIINNGNLTATANSLAAAASISVTNQGLAIASGAVWDGGTGAESVARGIDVGDGADMITNTGGITATTVATAAEAAVGVAVTGVAGAIATSNSDSRATAIYAGGEDDAAVDNVTNSGKLTADATANAVTAAVSVTTAGVAVAGGAVWDGGTTSAAIARGIETGGGEDGVDNAGDVTARSTARAAELSTAVAVSGVAGAIATSTGNSDAAAIHTGDGAAADKVVNSGLLTADADAIAATAAVSVTTAGVGIAGGAVWDGGTTATAVARGIAAGEGADEIDNRGEMNISADSKAAELAVSVAVTGVAGAIATSTGEAFAIGIDAGAGEYDDTVFNSGKLTVASDALAATGTVSVTTAGVAVAGGEVWDGGTNATTTARGIAVGEGADFIDNSGDIDVSSSSLVAELAVAVAVAGVAGASASSTGEADATAIDTGAGDFDDTVFNSGALKADADAWATAASVSVTTAGVAGSSGGAVWDGGTTGDARARGIDAGIGADSVHNEGDIEADADAVAASATVSVAVAGVAGSIGTSTAVADASGIDVSQGDDEDNVFTSGDITANATGLANTATVSVTPAGVAVSADAFWDGGTSSDTRARGIETGLGADIIENEAAVRATTFSEAASASVAVAVAGVAGAIATSTAEADSVGIDAGAGEYDDAIMSNGDVGAYADAIAASAAVSFTAAGVAVSGDAAWDGGTTARGSSVAMGLGEGNDAVFSDGQVTADSLATSTGIAASVAIAGVAGAITAANAYADATGIDLGAGDDQAETRDLITVSSLANANTVSNADAKFGVTVAGNNAWDGGTRGEATASGISAGTGIDTLDNSADINSTATVVAPSTAITFVVGGVGAAISTASADARANAIDGGADADRIDNLGNLEATADATAVAVNVSLTGAGAGVAADAVWDGGTTTDANAHGISGGAGDDVIISGDAEQPAEPNTVTASANSTAVSTSVAITGIGLSASTSTSTANADASGIDTGVGDDLVLNNSDVSGEANATAAAVSVSVTGAGVAGATDSFWDGGTSANGSAAGISGGDGIDTIVNNANVAATADAQTVSVSVAASLLGMGAAVAASTATGRATGLDGGAGDDTLRNEQSVFTKSLADGQGVSVAAVLGGIAVAGGLGAETRADAAATGMAGGDGNDSVGNIEGAEVRLESNATTVDTAVTVSLQGISVAQANAESIADAVGLSGGAGNDEVINDGDVFTVETGIDGTVTPGAVKADSTARGISIGLLGAGVATANASATATASGARGGDGDDLVANNGNMDLAATATSEGQSIGISGIGVAISDASANATAGGSALEGGDGVDTLENTGSVIVANTANTRTRSISAAALGAALGTANSVAMAEAGGAAGGAGNDILLNTGTGVVDVLAVADVVATAVSVSVAGASDGEAKTLTGVSATGLSGDAGDDWITNEGMVGVQGRSRSYAAGASVNVAGLSSAKAGTEVETAATGISGGLGADMLINTGTIRVGPPEGASDDARWMSLLDTSASSFGFAGDTNAESAAFARTTSTGIDGGDADDRILNDGEISVMANALSRTSGGTLNIFGTADAGGESGAITLATGLDGVSGNDFIETLGLLSVQAESLLEQDGTSFTFGGSGGSGSALEAATDAIGISGGTGQDQILTDGQITVAADSVLVSKGGGTTIFGGSAAAGKSGATTRATGIDGGGEDDTIDNAADITLSATSEVSLNNSSYTFGGSGNTSGTLGAITSVDGILGGDGLDIIFNSGDINIFAESALTSRGGSEATFGGSASATISGAITHAAGIAGGYADDIIENALASTIDVTAKTTVGANSVAYTFGGGSGADAILTGDASAEGMSGGDGNDQLLNDGFLKVLADATLTSTGGAKSTFSGGNVATGKGEARTRAVGMDGGAGDDDIVSSGFIDVQARTVAEARNDASSSVSFTSNEVSGSVSEATAEAIGLDGAAGSNSLLNSGNLSVSARSIGYALSYASGAIFSFDGNGTAKAESISTAIATGISSGDGDNTVLSEHQINVMAEAVTAKLLETTITVYRLQGNDDDTAEPPESGPETVKELPGTVGTGTDYPEGTIVYCTDPGCIVNPEVNEAGNYYQVVSTGGDSPTFSWETFAAVESLPVINDDYPEGTIVACTAIDCREDPAIKASATYYQVVSTGGDSPVFSWERFDGLTIEVDVDVIEDSFPSYAAANGNGLAGDGTAIARGTADASATGVNLGDGDNRLENRDQLTVEARAEAVFNASADGDAFGNATGTSDAVAIAHAVGIRLGDGNNAFLNTDTGNISVTASPVAQALTDVTGGDICIWFFGWWCGGGGTGNGTANASFEAEATGLTAGNGDNVITNNGAITVIAKPLVRLDERLGREFIADVRSENTEHITVLADAKAIGIQTGDGNNTVVNNDTVNVAAHDLLSGCDTQDCRNFTNIKGIDENSVAAIGVHTGAGNDVVINNGSISALEFRNNVSSAGVGIETGAGDDQLALGDGSTVIGSIDLGEGNDSLTLIGSPVVKNAADAIINPLASAGEDSLILQGAGSFSGVPASFEHAVKTAPGTFSLPELPAVQSLTIDEGTLALGSDYDFLADSSFSTYVHSDGDRGKLEVNGSVTLDGAIDVEKRGGSYVSNGTRYSVLETTGSLGNAFADVTLPAPTPLLRYDLEQTVNTVDTVVTAESFGIVAGNPLYRQIARNLDRIANDATGDLASVLGTLQSLESGFDRAFASASPDSYLVTTQSTVATGLQMTRLLQNHLNSSRVTYRHSLQGQAAASGNVSFAYNNGIGAIGLSSAPVVAGRRDSRYMLAANEYSDTAVSQAIPQQATARNQAWIQVAKADGDYDEVDGYTDFDTDSRIVALGYDLRLSKRLVVGGTLGYAKTDLDMDQAGAEGDIKAWSGGAYASWFNDRAYLEGGISYASQSFDNQRSVVIGSTKRRARSDHDGDVWMGFLGTGYQFGFNDWSLEPYGSLYYFNAQEDSFRETGADSLNQTIEDRDTEALVGEVGAKVARLQRLGKGTLDWHGSVGLNHDFDIDDARIAYSYAGAPGTIFEIDDRDLDSNSTVFGAGVSYTSGRSTISLDYRRHHNDDYDNDAVYAGMVVRF